MGLWLQQVRNDAGSQETALPYVSVTLYRSCPGAERGRRVMRCASPGSSAALGRGQAKGVMSPQRSSLGAGGCYTGLGL